MGADIYLIYLLWKQGLLISSFASEVERFIPVAFYVVEF